MIRDLFQTTIRGPWKTAGLDVQYRVAVDNKCAWLFFQQTGSGSDWRLNLDTWIEPYKDMPVPWKAHRGFVRAWKSARDEIFKAVGHPDTLTISGYSHGGALATLAHEDFHFHGMFVSTYTFGAPRVAWMPPGAIQSRFGMLTRIKTRGDIFTNLPPAIAGFRHVGNGKEYGPWMPPNPWAHRPGNYLGAL